MVLTDNPETSRVLAKVLSSPYWYDHWEAKAEVVDACEKVDKFEDLPGTARRHIEGAKAAIVESVSGSLDIG